MEQLGMMQKKQQQIVKDLNEIDILEEQGSLDEANFKKRLELQQEFWKVATFNELLLLQKSRAKWVKEGNCNKKFFHSIINWKRRKNMVKRVHVDGR